MVLLARVAAASTALCTIVGATPIKPATIAPGVVMPMINNGAITNGSWFPSNTLETPGIEEWLHVGGRGIDTAWCYHNQPQVGVAISNSSSAVPRENIFVTTKVRACACSWLLPQLLT